MKYRIVQTRIVEANPSDPVEHWPNEKKVVWLGSRDEEFERKACNEGVWHTTKDFPTSSFEGWVVYSYHLEQLDEDEQKWRYVCRLVPLSPLDDDYK